MVCTALNASALILSACLPLPAIDTPSTSSSIRFSYTPLSRLTMASKCSYSRPTSACDRVWCSDEVDSSSCQRDCSAVVMAV